MRILVAGSRDFFAGYRIDRALTRASKDHYSSDMTLITLGQRTRRGADRSTRELAEAMGWELDRAEHVSEARADVCLAFLHLQDPPDDKSRITAMKAEKAGIPVWRYYEGRAVAHAEDVPMAADLPTFDDIDDLPEWQPAMTVTPNGNGTFTISWESAA